MWKIVLIILLLLYLLSPYDLIPDMLMGWGWIDDLVILGLIWRYFYLQNKKRRDFQKYQQTERETRGSGNNGSRAGPNARESSPPWDPYKVLEIEKGASREEIKHAYRRLAGKYHPDKVAHLGEEFKALAERRFKEIQQAYEELRPR